MRVENELFVTYEVLFVFVLLLLLLYVYLLGQPYNLPTSTLIPNSPRTRNTQKIRTSTTPYGNKVLTVEGCPDLHSYFHVDPISMVYLYLVGEFDLKVCLILIIFLYIHIHTGQQ